MIAGASQNTAYAGVISGSGKLIKAGYGILKLTGSNTYTGGTDITAGALSIDGSTVLKSTDVVTITNNAVLSLDGNTTQTIRSLISSSSNAVVQMFHEDAVLTVQITLAILPTQVQLSEVVQLTKGGSR